MIEFRICRASFQRVLAAAACIAGTAVRAGADEPAFDSAAAIERLRPAVVVVEYTLQFHESEPPEGAGLTSRCPSCGQMHVVGDLSAYVAEDRPLEQCGYLIAPDRVVSPDPQLHPRFIRAVRVRAFGAGDSTPASLAAYGVRQNAVLLALEAPLAGAAPLAFDGAGAASHALSCSRAGTLWNVSVGSIGERVTCDAMSAEALVRSAPAASVLLNASGQVVGVTMNAEIPASRDGGGSPLQWQWLTREDYDRRLAAIQERAAATVLRVTLNFRSPSTDADANSMMRRYMMDEEGAAETERDVLGVVTGARQILVLADLDVSTTARLERVSVYGAGGAVSARFVASLREHGALIVETEADLAGHAPFAQGDLKSAGRVLYPSVETRMVGATVIQYAGHLRLQGLEPGRRNRPYPDFSGGSEAMFIFTAEGELAALPLAHREKAGAGRWDREDAKITPVAYVAELLADLPGASDPGIIPLSEEQENRVAWLGVELQSLSAELARANQVSEATRNGQTGGMVTYVYPDSPAAAADVRVGDVLARLGTPTRAEPIEVSVEDHSFFGSEFPWEHYDSMPEEYLDQMPRPWPPVDSPLNRLVTKIGFGQPYSADFYRDGQLLRREFTVSESPHHYGNAPRAKSETLGLTVRDITFEVAHYFRRAPGEAGVIIGRIERGSRAAVAGLKPYEIITSVDDAPAVDAATFERLIGDSKGELRLGVRRMHQARIVKLSAPAEEESSN